MNEKGTEVLPIPGTVMPDPAPDDIYIRGYNYTLEITRLASHSGTRTTQVNTAPAQTRGEVADRNARLIENGGEPLFLTAADAIRHNHERHPQPEPLSYAKRLRSFGHQLLNH